MSGFVGNIKVTGGEERLIKGEGTKPECDVFSSEDSICTSNIVFVTLAYLFALERSSNIMTCTGP